MTTATAHEPDQLVVENLNTLRFRAGLSQRDLGVLIDVGSGTISRKMSRRSDFTLSEARVLSDALCVSLEELTGDLPSFDEWAARWSVRHQGLEPRTR